MNRKRARSSFSTSEPKCHDPSLTVVDDLHDLWDSDRPLSPLTPTEDSPNAVLSDEEVLCSSKWCRQAEDGWGLPGEDKDDLKYHGKVRGLSIDKLTWKDTDAQPSML